MEDRQNDDHRDHRRRRPGHDVVIPPGPGARELLQGRRQRSSGSLSTISGHTRSDLSYEQTQNLPETLW
ncbi:hypothetical protein [Sphaerisporangium sp. NPDC051011]|uniref:hypothetical protein n=1 Tax=Sphaerisporangium sp. NPDC051011 TaxID=3155792 RepID=UPI0033FEED94